VEAGAGEGGHGVSPGLTSFLDVDIYVAAAHVAAGGWRDAHGVIALAGSGKGDEGQGDGGNERGNGEDSDRAVPQEPAEDAQGIIL
jgi:hypothetical protein